MDDIAAVAFLIFGLGFFLFVVWIIRSDHEAQWTRRVQEMREFGFYKQKRKDRRKETRELK